MFDDERAGFERHLRWMRDWGEFISLDRAVELLSSAEPFGGRYFCVTFDDGIANCLHNALPILQRHACSAAIFVVTDCTGLSLERDAAALSAFFSHANYPGATPLLDWTQCRQLTDAGVTIGSHTANHVRLTDLDAAAARAELQRSKQAIETHLGVPCDHFACPWGGPGRDFDPQRHPDMAKQLGYRSFLTTVRGLNRHGDSPLAMRRDHLLANWPRHQLRYFLRGA
ncbi:putative polysaccharide deacetylase [Magnetofaba australis IT-1]|uniref:Putative polysaccharide deacetylase n=1 Tax=Magnetofaba australis IT-1 TaxID=1434232 RepID=A0A1Y2KB20_9PROT|nr:putative polysaccharide deacetylase [Magnetofaba australis IT-1]